ncbi:MAG: hypothetical protein J1F12_03530 [Muribaculaceae bacterium]|nr:hypothetical protein [Muribaculaceae bacterium]
MKILRFLPIAAIAFLAASCQNGGSASLSENSSQTDSLMYYLGQMNAADYLREANRDTTMKENSQKQAYLSGVRAGLAALKDGNEAYNKGVMLGMQMASQMMSFCEQMGVEINKNSYIGSLQSAILADTLPNTVEAQTNFRTVMNHIEAAKEERDQQASRESLKQVAQGAALPMISEDLYGKVVNANDSAALTEGEEVNLVGTFTKENGEELNLPLPPKGKIGNKRNFPEILSSAMLTLKSGETGEFLTTAHALLGNRTRQMNLEPTDVIKMQITPTAVPKPEEKEDKAK